MVRRSRAPLAFHRAAQPTKIKPHVPRLSCPKREETNFIQEPGAVPGTRHMLTAWGSLVKLEAQLGGAEQPAANCC